MKQLRPQLGVLSRPWLPWLVIAGVGCGGAGEPAGSGPEGTLTETTCYSGLPDGTQTVAPTRDPISDKCQAASAAGAQEKLDAKLVEIYAAAPGARRVLISYTTSAQISTLFNCDRGDDCPDGDAMWAELERRVEAIQHRTKEAVRAAGGEVLESFVVGNATLVRVDHAQALAVAALADVRGLCDADTPGPRPDEGL